MKIKYIREEEITYCCKKMERYMNEYSYIHYKSKLGLCIDFNFYANQVHIDYCPFCGEKIEIIGI